MRFNEYARQGFRMLLFEKKAVKATMADKDAARNGFSMLLAVSALVGLLGGAFFYLALYLVSRLAGSVPIAPTSRVFVYAVIAFFVISILAHLLSVGITHLLAKLFGGKRKILPYFAVWMTLGFALLAASILVMFLAIIPYLGQLFELAFMGYSLLLTVFIVQESYGLSKGRAAAAVLIPLLVFIALVVLLYVLYLAPVGVA